MNNSLVFIFKFSIIIALIFGVVRYGKISHTYRPFIFIIIGSFLTELIGTIMARVYHSNAVSANIYYIVDFILWLWQFRKWNDRLNKQWVTYALPTLAICFWALETIIKGINNFNSSFAVFYSFTLVFLAINQVNKLIVEEKTNLLKNAKFLICSGVIIFYSYSVLVESFYMLKLDQSDSFLAYIYYILIYVNLFVNLLYALAILWIPTRERFTLPSLLLPVFSALSLFTLL